MSYDNILIFQFSLSILYILIAFIYKLPLIQVRKLKISYPLIWGIILFLNLLFSAYIVSTFGVSLNYFSFNEVYSIRANYISTLSRVGGLLPYIIGWQANILNPVIIIEGLMRRNYYYLMMGLVGQLIIYSITGFKSVFFSVVLIFLIYIITSFFKRDKIANIFLWGSAFSVLLAIVTHFNNSNILSSLLLQRTIVMPGLLSGQYYQFFSENAKALLGHSIFRNIVQYPYSVQPPFLIGDFYYNSPSTEANANIWADAFANFGNWGIIIYTILFALVLWIYDSISKDLDYRFASMMLAVPSFTLANSSLLTSMLTHGILLCFIIIYLLPSTKYSNKHKNYSITNMINIIFKFMKEIKDVKSL
ncbi:hypothetical protein [Paenibacillus silviterrae]|uniref:hypothetical protein n=1 Tax=Paenibacillus silviterrae TaxID=3242194 RepID=UPI002542CE95|nr:hypothetical protein [Paenibacillus chinjuensis]